MQFLVARSTERDQRLRVIVLPAEAPELQVMHVDAVLRLARSAAVAVPLEHQPPGQLPRRQLGAGRGLLLGGTRGEHALEKATVWHQSHQVLTRQCLISEATYCAGT